MYWQILYYPFANLESCLLHEFYEYCWGLYLADVYLCEGHSRDTDACSHQAEISFFVQAYIFVHVDCVCAELEALCLFVLLLFTTAMSQPEQ